MLRTITFRNVFFVALITALVGCKSGSIPVSDQNELVFIAKTKDDTRNFLQLIEKSESAVQKILKANGIGNSFSIKDIVQYCSACDSTIFTIKGLTRSMLPTQGETPPPSGTGKTGVSGESDSISYSSNYLFTMPAPGRKVSRTPANVIALPDNPVGRNAAAPVLVGVIDTGIDPAVADKYKPDSVSTCLDNAAFGYNFCEENNQTTDNFGGTSNAGEITQHGTPVSKLIIEEAVPKTAVKLLPIKVVNAEGKADLYHVMCGLAYAKKAGARIINFSLGFYADRQQGAPVFEKFISRLTQETDNDKSLIIVAAAGNADENADKYAKKVNHIPDTSLRNLDKHPFLPAAFSDSNKNIITVTTIYKDNAGVMTVVPTQNYSPTRVQVGVKADSLAYFKEPYDSKLRMRMGSSFAAPVVTGVLSSNYSTLLSKINNGKLNRSAVLAALLSHSQSLSPVPSATSTCPAFIKVHIAQ